MRNVMIPAGLAGLALAIGLIAYFGVPAVAAAVAASGWAFVAVTVYHAVGLVFTALAWQALLANHWPQPLTLYLFARAVREGASNLLPVVQIGGEVIGARILALRGAAPTMAAASVIADLTLETLMQLVFTALGLVLLALLGLGGGMMGWLMVGLGVGTALLAGFLLAQRYGLFRLVESLFDRFAAERGWASLGAMAGLHDAVNAVYRDRRMAVAGAAWHLTGWIVGSGEIWLAFHFMGIPLGVVQAVALESLVHAIRSAAFFVPLGLGVQEGGFVLAGALFGIGPEAALAVSLIKRARDLLLGVPPMLAWQAIEGRRWAVTRAWRREGADEPR